MRKLNRCVLILVLLIFILGCNPVQEMREGRVAAEKANKEAKMVLEKIKEYAEKAEAAAQRAEKAAASSENFSKKAEAASQKAVETFEKQLKK
jgi:predicted Holliday junction resolvase-like endonuclease